MVAAPSIFVGDHSPYIAVYFCWRFVHLLSPPPPDALVAELEMAWLATASPTKARNGT
jgi:hypothetical protein